MFLKALKKSLRLCIILVGHLSLHVTFHLSYCLLFEHFSYWHIHSVKYLRAWYVLSTLETVKNQRHRPSHHRVHSLSFLDFFSFFFFFKVIVLSMVAKGNLCNKWRRGRLLLWDVKQCITSRSHWVPAINPAYSLNLEVNIQKLSWNKIFHFSWHSILMFENYALLVGSSAVPTCLGTKSKYEVCSDWNLRNMYIYGLSSCPFCPPLPPMVTVERL